MKKLLVSIAVVLFLACVADAAQPKISPDRINTSLPFPSITMSDGANITLDGGYISGAPNIEYGTVVIKNDVTGVVQAFQNGELIGNGTDDFAICQIALDALDEDNKSIDFYGRQFVGNVPLLVPDYCYMDGHGSQFVDDQDNDTVYDSIFTDADPTTVKDFQMRKFVNVYVDGIDKLSVNYCWNLSRMRYAVIENCVAMHAIKDGFLIRDDSWGIFLFNLYTYDNSERGIHFAEGPNDAPNTAVVRGGLIMADDDHSIFIEAGNDIWISNVDINSAGVGVYCLADSPTIESCYMEALTYGFYWGDGSNRVDNALIRNNHMYSVTNFIASVNQLNTRLEGNFVDGVAIDTFSGWSTGTGSEQSIDFPATLVGSPYDVRVWNIETGATSNPVFYTDETWTCINVTAQNGINYRYKVQTSL